MDLSDRELMLLILAGTCALAMLWFAVGRGLLLAQRSAAINEAGQARHETAKLRQLTDEQRREDAGLIERLKNQTRQQSDMIRALENDLTRLTSQQKMIHDLQAKHLSELEALHREKQQVLDRRDRDFRERMAHLNQEFKTVITRLATGTSAIEHDMVETKSH